MPAPFSTGGQGPTYRPEELQALRPNTQLTSLKVPPNSPTCPLWPRSHAAATSTTRQRDPSRQTHKSSLPQPATCPTLPHPVMTPRLPLHPGRTCFTTLTQLHLSPRLPPRQGASTMSLSILLKFSGEGPKKINICPKIFRPRPPSMDSNYLTSDSLPKIHHPFPPMNKYLGVVLIMRCIKAGLKLKIIIIYWIIIQPK